MTKELDDEMRKFNEKRDALFRNPTMEAAVAHLTRIGFTHYHREDVPLAMVHKARLQWLEVTDAMIEESMAWLIEHDYQADMNGAPPLTPGERDTQRVALGKKPLNDIVS
jgi:hypothetical protein